MRLPLALAFTFAAGCSDYTVIVRDGGDVFYQDPSSEVDILLVVDDSCSMGPYQSKLSTNFEEFISFFTDANVDYHIGVITTDVMAESAGNILGDIITTETENASDVFGEIVSVGTAGSGNEMGLHAAYLALTEPRVSTTNAGFIRDTASLSVLFVSDEEDASPLPTAGYVNQLRDIKDSRDRAVFNASALVVTNVDECTSAAQAGSSRGDRYLDVAAQSSGVSGSICADSFSDIITELSLNASRLMDTFYLTDMPAPNSIEVSVNETALPCEDGGWTYTLVEQDDGPALPAVVFQRDQLPGPSSQIAIRYDFGDGDPEGFCTGSTSGDTGSAQ